MNQSKPPTPTEPAAAARMSPAHSDLGTSAQPCVHEPDEPVSERTEPPPCPICEEIERMLANDEVPF